MLATEVAFTLDKQHVGICIPLFSCWKRRKEGTNPCNPYLAFETIEKATV